MNHNKFQTGLLRCLRPLNILLYLVMYPNIEFEKLATFLIRQATSGAITYWPGPNIGCRLAVSSPYDYPMIVVATEL